MKNKALLIALATVAVASQAQAVLVYDNLAAPSTVVTGIGAGTLTGIWGDAVTLTQGGLLDKLSLTVFNGSTAGVLTSATVNVAIFDNTTPYVSGDLQTTRPLLGAFNGNVNFGTGLNPGFFSTVNFTGLAGFNFVLPQNIMITQFYTNIVGNPTSLGVAAFSTDNVGTGTPANFYAQFGASEGLFSLAAGQNNLGYSVDVVPEPASMTALALGAAFIARRKRKNA